MSTLIISVSGLRGIVGESLTNEVATRYATAFAAELPPGPVVVTRDGRASGPGFAEAILAQLAALGRPALDAGVAATPTLGVLVRQRSEAGGIQISASHNPAEYNGLKLFSAAGRVVSARDGAAVLTRYEVLAGGVDSACAAIPERREKLADTTTAHWELIRDAVDVERIRQRRFRVLLDANHGAGSVLGRRLLEELGCQATILGDVPDGRFDHQPEPTAENLAGVLAAVRSAGADVGFCQDPDADRLAVVDAAGRYLGEEYTPAMCANHILRRRPGPVVTNCSTSRMTEDVAARYGVPFYRSPVGEANVVDTMLAHQAVFGGEGNGGVIDPRVVLVRDSFIGMALLLDAMAERELTIAALADELPRYAIHKTKATVPAERVPAALAALEKHFAGATTSRLDGLRLDWPGRWLLVRASNTEPIVRAIAEAPTAAEAERLCSEATTVLNSLSGE